MPCSPGMARCKAGCRHRSLVFEYRIERHHQEQRAERACKGYATERAEYVERRPLITFREWLIGHAERVEVAA